MGHSGDFKDKRQHARFDLLEYAMVYGSDPQNVVRSVVIDVSLGGLQVRSRQQFVAGDTYTLNIGRIDSKPLIVQAEARYSNQIEDTDLYATGFKCQSLSSVDKMDWVDYVHSIFKSQGESLVG